MKIKEAIEEFKKEVKKLYGERLKRIILYGSYARGSATEDSDIDLLIVLEGKVKPGEEIDRMIDIIYGNKFEIRCANIGLSHLRGGL